MVVLHSIVFNIATLLYTMKTVFMRIVWETVYRVNKHQVSSTISITYFAAVKKHVCVIFSWYTCNKLTNVSSSIIMYPYIFTFRLMNSYLNCKQNLMLYSVTDIMYMIPVP